MEDFFNGEKDQNSQNIISIDLSHFNSSLVTNTKNMFNKCSSLEYLDMSNFDFSNINGSDGISNMISGSEAINYINLNNVKNYDIYKNEILDNSNLNTKDNLTVCQSELIIDNKNATYVCPFPKYNSTNYIIIYYGDNVTYENGFIFNNNESNNYRNDVDFIIYEKNTYFNSIYLEIKPNSKVEINLKPSTKSLAHFFDSNYDLNMKNVISIDFTHFNASLITDMNSLFKDCNSLETIIVSNLNTSLVTNMSEMFYGCSNLIEVDLSTFDISSVIDMHNMFNGCTNLELIDLYNITMDKIITAHDMFKNLENLKYIDLIDANNTFNNITETQLNRKDGLMVCQKENLINNENAQYQCCYYNTSAHKCDSGHYIIFISGKNITYKSGFVISTGEKGIRDNTLFTVINRKKIDNEEKLDILPNTKVEIHFPSDITTLESLFDSNYDKNVEYIEKIDFSPFNSSTVKIMSHLFDGCSSLNSIYLTKFDTSAATDMSYMFSRCNSLKYINLSNFSTKLVTNMSNMFSGAILIASFNLSHFNTESTTDMSYMFSGCNSAELIDVSNFATKSVINMSNMFSGCALISSLNLSSFDTSNTIDMSGMFYGCDNLEYLDISNFNVEKCNSYDNMFSNYNNLKYIDIKNIKSDKMFKDSFKNTELFYVCQSMIIIRNSHAYNCCEYNIEAHKCDYIINTEISTTQLESSEMKQITTQLEKIESSAVISSIVQTTVPKIPSTVPKVIETTIPTTVTTKTPTTNRPIIPTTLTTKVPTTIPNIETTTQKQVFSTLIEKTDMPNIETASVVLLGFSHFKMETSFFSFFMYLVRIKNMIYSKTFGFPLTITSNTNMRMLKEIKGNCTLNNIYNDNNYEFLCGTNEDTSNIKSIGVGPGFKNLENIEIVGISPLAKMFMNNIQLVGDKFDMLSNCNIFVLDNSTCIKYGKNLFNISGEIDGTQPVIKNDNLSLMINLQSEDETQTEVDCIINNTLENNYELNCKSKQALDMDLQSALTFMDSNNILLINMFLNLLSIQK